MLNNLPRYNRKIFVGDVHGCFDELKELLSSLEYDCNYDQLYFVGDLVNKGPDSNGVVDFVKNTKNCYCVMGNHDHSIILYAKHRKTMITTENIEYLKSLPYYMYADTNKSILVCHAGIIPDPKIKITEQNKINLMKIRHVQILHNEMVALETDTIGTPWISYYNGFNGHIFFGHDAKKLLQIGVFATGLDTGCCYGNWLTAAIVKCDKQFQLCDDYQKSESEYKLMSWETDSKKYLSCTPNKFIYRIYCQKSHQPKSIKTVQPCKHTQIQLLNQLIDNFSSK
eukprot:256399_1